MLKLTEYDKVLVAFSGGKDSQAIFLWALESGIPLEKIELWHHDIDGDGPRFMDWNCTRSYCQKFADAFGVPLYFSYKCGGFEGEMLRDGQPTAPTYFETPTGSETRGGKGPNGTRRKFPQVSANLSVRWCSAYLKIDVMSTAIRNQERFNHSKTLVLTGERAEESSARAKYDTYEVHRTDLRTGRKARHVDHFRPVHHWTETQVWDIIERYKVNPHPAYRLGWGRLSCITCIFGNADQWASAAVIAPEQVGRIIDYEAEFGTTIQRKESVQQMLCKGAPYQMSPSLVSLAQAEEFTEPIIVQTWEMPVGAFKGHGCGPT